MNNKNVFLVYFYLTELGYRIFYILVSFIVCFIVSFQNIELLLLIETYPFLKFSNKKFIITHTTDLINSIWYLAFSNSCFMVFPIFIYQTIQFSKTSWYSYQLYFSRKILILPLVNCYMCLILCYFKIFPPILYFLTQWDLNQTTTFLSLEIEFRILNYLNWILTLRYGFIFLSYITIILIIHISFLALFRNVYKLMKYHRSKFTFLALLILFILTPPDMFLQFFLIFTILIFHEFVFFVFCYKACSSKI